MFRMYGRTVQVLRYQFTTTELQPDEHGELVETPVTGYATTEEEASALGGDVIAIELDDDAWMDGLEVADVPDTFGEALKIRDMGREAYERAKALERSPEQLRADVDYLAAMTGVIL